MQTDAIADSTTLSRFGSGDFFMGIDAGVETLVQFSSEARTAFPGRRRLGYATLHRWRSEGVRGVRLETILVGGLRYTSREAIDRFIEAQNAADFPAPVITPAQNAADAPAPVITPAQRRRQATAARAELERAGVR